MVPVKNLAELRWYGGYRFTREREMGTLTISHKTFADELVKMFCVTSTHSCSTSSRCKTRRVQSPVPRRMKKEKKLVVANIEILQCVARGGPRRSLSLPEKRPESPRHIFC